MDPNAANSKSDKGGSKLTDDEGWVRRSRLNKFIMKLSGKPNPWVNMTILFFVLWTSVVLAPYFVFVIAGGRPIDPETGEELEDEYCGQRFENVRRFFSFQWYKKFTSPSFEKLLPDPLQYPYIQPRYTLVLEYKNVLLCADHTLETGWRFKKRPNVDYFLEQIQPPMFETVIFTQEHGMTAFAIIDQLDKKGAIMYRLFRDSTRFMKNHHVKDLSFLNRDLKRVIFVDYDEKSFQLQPENALKLKKWEGNDDDVSLVDLAALLQAIAESGADDVRPLLEHYRGVDDPLKEFRQKQLQVQHENERKLKENEDKLKLRQRFKVR